MSNYDALCGLFDLQKVAELWHGGQSTALYSFLSTQRIHSEEHADECLAEIRDCTVSDEDGEDAYWELENARGALEHIAADFAGFNEYLTVYSR